MKKTLAILLALVMVVTLFAGCNNNNPAPETKTGSVFWLNFKPESDEALKKLAAMYTEETGVPVEILTAASGTGKDKKVILTILYSLCLLSVER